MAEEYISTGKRNSSDEYVSTGRRTSSAPKIKEWDLTYAAPEFKSQEEKKRRDSIREQSYTIQTNNGKQYTIGQNVLDRIRSRHLASFDSHYDFDDEDQWNKANGYMPRSYQQKYKNTEQDQWLFNNGLPSSAYFDDYVTEAINYFGDGSYFNPDKDQSDYIKTQMQSSWKYDNTPEDLKRKMAGQMPLKQEAKYKDKDGNFLSYQDEMYFSMGLPSSSEMYNYSYMYGDYVNKTNRVNEFYGAAAVDVVNELLIKGIKNDDTLYTQEDGKTVTGKDLWEQEYYRFINSSDEWADIRSWVQPDDKEDVFTPKPEWSTKQAEEERMAWQADQDAKAAAADDPYLIDPDYDDFLAFFDTNAEKVYTQKIAYDAGAGFESELTYEDYIENEYEQNVRNMYAGITDEKSLDNFLDEVSDEKNYAQTITNLKDYGVSKKLIRKAKNKLIDKTEDEGVQQAIKDAFDAPTIIKVTDDMLDGGIGLPRRAGKVSERDAVFDKKLETFTEALQTRAESDDISTQAVDAYYAALEYDEYNRVTVESAERGLDAALAAGATPNTIRKIVAEFDERFAVGDPNTIVSGTAFLSSYANGVIEQAEVKLIKDAIPAFRVSLAEQGASQFEIDQALRRAGYGEYLEDGESAYNYFVSKGYTQFVDELQMEELSEQPVEVQRAFAQQMWETLPAEERQAYVANFGETQMVNPEIHKNVMDSVKDYVSGRFIDNLVLGLASSTVSFADMAVGKFTGSTKEQWEITKTLGDMYTWSRSYGKSETQGGGMGAFNVATTVSDELLRMSVLGKAGGLVGKGATAVTSKIPALAKATSALNLTSDIAKEMSKNTSGIGKYGFSATSKFARGVANVVSGASLSRAPFITNAMGSYFNEAMSFTDENGNPPSRRDATTYAFWCGLLEGAVESFNVDTWTSKALGSKKLAGIVAQGGKGYTRSSLARRAIASHLIASAAGEFGEESMSYAATWFMQRQTYNPDAEFDWGEFLESGGMGALIGFVGAGMHAGSYSASGIIYNYMENNGFDADFFDLLHVATQVEALPQKNYEQNSEATEWLPLEEYKSVQRDLASHARQLESSKQNYNAARGKIDAEVQLKVDAVEALRGRIQALNDGRLTPEKAKELGGLMESLRVAESELSTERAQAENKLSELQSAYKETTAQHRAAIEKAQAKVDAHNVAMYNFFLPDIASMRGMSAAQLQHETAAIQQANSEAILQGAYRSESFYEGMFDEMDAASEDAAIAYSNLAQAEETLAATAGTVDSVRKKISRMRQTNKAAYEAGVAEAKQNPVEQPTEQTQRPSKKKSPLHTRAEWQLLKERDARVKKYIEENKGTPWRDLVRNINENMRYEDMITIEDATARLMLTGVLNDIESGMSREDLFKKSLDSRDEYDKLAGKKSRTDSDLYMLRLLGNESSFYEQASENPRRFFAELTDPSLDLHLENEHPEDGYIDYDIVNGNLVPKDSVSNTQHIDHSFDTIDLDDDAINRVTELGNKLGRTVVVEDLPDGVNGRYDGDGVLHINRKQLAKVGDHPELIVFVHELTHSIETSKYYNKFSEAAIQYARNAFVPTEQFPTFEAKYNDFARAVAEGRARNGYQTTEEDVRRDFVATFASERMFSDPDAVRAMAKTNSNLVSRVYNQIRYWLHNFFPSGEGSRAEQDLRQLERLYAMALYEAKVKPSEDARQFASENAQYSTGLSWDSYFAQDKPKVEYSDSFDSDGKQLSSEQQEYFKDSKVRDEIGNLLKVYHGSPNKFTTFRQGTADGWGTGIYFTNNRTEAENYGENIVEAYLNISNPFNADAMSYYDIGAENTKAYIEYDKEVWRRSYNEYDSYEEYKADGLGADMHDIYAEEVETFNKILRELGYDGIIADGSNGIDGLEIVAFNENQVKLADNTAPTTNPDIRYSTGISWDDLGSQYGVHEQGMNPRAREIAVPVSTDGTDRTSLFLRTALESSNVTDESVRSIVSAVEQEQFGTYAPQSDAKLLEKARNYIVEVGGITNAVESFHNDVMRGNNSALNAALGMQLLSELKNDTPASLDILADLCIIATESGRTTQSFSMLKKLGGVGSAYYMKRLESRFNEKYKKQIANGKTGAFKIPDNLMQNLVDAKSAYEIEAAEDAVTKYLGSVMPLSFAERMQNWRYFAMLSKPSTHMRNIMGNALMLAANAGKNVVATGLERALIPKEQRTHAIYNPANQQDRMAAARLAFTENERDITASGGKYGFDQEVARHKRKAKLGIVNAPMEATFKALEFEDRIFLQIGYVDAYTQYLVAQDIDPANMTRQQKANAHAWAKRQAHDITFRDASKLADMLNSIANKGTAAKVIVDGAIPFKKTPVNVAARAVEYSPLGLSKTIYKFTKGIKDGTSTPADAIDHLSRNITGTVAVCTLGYFLSKLGVLRGIGDEEEKVEDFKAATGERNYSFNVTIDGKNYAIDASGIAPMNIPLFMGAAFYEATEGSGEDFTFSDFVALATEVTNPLMEMSFLSSLDSVLSSYSSEGFGGNIGGMVWQSVKNYGSQYIPSAVAGIASAVDPIQRSTAGDPTQLLGRAEDRYAKSIINRIPFLSKTLEPKVDIHGEIDTASFRTEFGKWALELANNMILPARITVKNRNSVDEALIRMYEETGRTDIFPAVPKNNAFQHKKEPYQMNASQFTDYSVELGNETYAAIKAAMSSSYWDDLTDVARADLIADTIDETKEKMRVKYLDILGAYDK